MEWPNLDTLADALGVPFKEAKAGVYEARLTNIELGIRLKLEVAPNAGAARLYVDRNRSTSPTFVGRTDFFSITDVIVEADRVRFIATPSDSAPNELLVTKAGAFRVVVGIDPEKVTDIPDETVDELTDPELVTVLGKVGNPVYTDHNNMPFWRAGIGIPKEDSIRTFVWSSVKAWKGVATHAKDITKGQMVKVTGRWVDETYTNRNGEEITQRVLHATYVELCG